MRFSATEEYGLRCLLVLARKGPGDRLSIPDIAEMEGISVPYASKLLSKLRKAGLVTTVRGRKGGFYIARPPDEICLLEVITGLGGPLIDPDHCLKRSGRLERCVHVSHCSVHDMLGGLAGYVAGFLGSTSLADIISGTLPPAANRAGSSATFVNLETLMETPAPNTEGVKKNAANTTTKRQGTVKHARSESSL